jgi:hypothetical protein
MMLPSERSLRSQLELARQIPELADLKALLIYFDQVLAEGAEEQRLQLAGHLFLQVAELYAIRADILIAEWESGNRDPVVEGTFFSDIVRQSMELDLHELLEPEPPRKRRVAKAPDSAESEAVVITTDKTAVLEMLTQLEEQLEVEPSSFQDNPASIWRMSHEESVSEWVEAIAAWMQNHTDEPTVSLKALHQALGIPFIDLWLGLLLGEFELEQVGEFYSSTIWVKNQALT